MTGEIGGVTAAFRDLLGRLMTFRVDWQFEADGDYEIGADRVEAPLEDANVVSSALRSHWLKPKGIAPDILEIFGDDLLEPQRHVVALDIDYPAHLIPSATQGHFHLYLEVPGGVVHDDYMELLEVLGRMNIIEPGYSEVSRHRGHTDLRLPWVAKEARPVRPAAEPVPLPTIPIDEATGLPIF